MFSEITRFRFVSFDQKSTLQRIEVAVTYEGPFAGRVSLETDPQDADVSPVDARQIAKALNEAADKAERFAAGITRSWQPVDDGVVVGDENDGEAG
jgi:hypothetical protein